MANTNYKRFGQLVLFPNKGVVNFEKDDTLNKTCGISWEKLLEYKEFLIEFVNKRTEINPKWNDILVVEDTFGCTNSDLEDVEEDELDFNDFNSRAPIAVHDSEKFTIGCNTVPFKDLIDLMAYLGWVEHIKVGNIIVLESKVSGIVTKTEKERFLVGFPTRSKHKKAWYTTDGESELPELTNASYFLNENNEIFFFKGNNQAAKVNKTCEIEITGADELSKPSEPLSDLEILTIQNHLNEINKIINSDLKITMNIEVSV